MYGEDKRFHTRWELYSPPEPSLGPVGPLVLSVHFSQLGGRGQSRQYTKYTARCPAARHPDWYRDYLISTCCNCL